MSVNNVDPLPGLGGHEGVVALPDTGANLIGKIAVVVKLAVAFR